MRPALALTILILLWCRASAQLIVTVRDTEVHWQRPWSKGKIDERSGSTRILRYRGNRLINVLLYHAGGGADSTVYVWDAGRIAKTIVYVKQQAVRWKRTDSSGYWGANLEYRTTSKWMMCAEVFRSELPFRNEAHLLDDDLRYFEAVLHNSIVDSLRRLSLKARMPAQIVTHTKGDLSMITGFCGAPFFLGRNLTKLIFYQQKRRLTRVQAVFFDAVAAKPFRYDRYYRYDSAGRLTRVWTTLAASGKLEASRVISYSGEAR